MSEEKKSIICPACQKKMTEIFISSAGIALDVCLDGCGGIYFDNREYKKVDEQHENIDEILEAIKGKEFIKVDEMQERICPVCGAKMVKNHASTKHEILVDDCYNCGGKFLDNGELQKIRAQYKTEAERSADMMALAESMFGEDIKRLEEDHKKFMKGHSFLEWLFTYKKRY